MTNRRIRVVQPTDTVKTLRGAGDEYRCLATGRETDNGYFLVVAIVPPGGGPPLHAQTREEEAFYVLEGELTFYSEEGRISARAGRYLNVPKGAQHRFGTRARRRPGCWSSSRPPGPNAAASASP